MTTFDALGVPAPLVAALAARGITEPLPVQALTIADAMAGRDVCGRAQTGSGKTLAFGLPLLCRTPAGRHKRPGGLVLVPTRELAEQVRGVLAPLARAHGIEVAAVFGGASMAAQVKALRRGADIVVATPGRFIDLGERGEVLLDNVGVLVLDEADRMCDMGFRPQVEWVLERLRAEHQTLLFSATLDGDVDRLVRTMRSPVHHEVAGARPTVDAMSHRFFHVHHTDKVKTAAALARGAFRALVFVRTKRGADRLMGQFKAEGVAAGVLHGGLTQGARKRAMAQFRSGQVGLLVATDIAARGIDVDGVDVVVHFDPPEDHKTYLHRSGRTARAGESGMAVSLLLRDQVNEANRLRRRLSITQPVVELHSGDARLGDLASADFSGARAVATAAPVAATGTDGAAPFVHRPRTPGSGPRRPR